MTVRSKIGFADGKVVSVTHDWVFDEMYSSFATQGLAKPGELVTRDIFAPLARQNAGGLAEIGYFTTLKIGGQTAEFAPVKDGDYWMEERSDHLVTFHVDAAPEDADRAGAIFLAAGRRPRIFHRLRVRRQRRDRARLRALGLLGLDRQAEAARRPGQDEAHRIVLQRPRGRHEFRLQDGEPRHRRLPMIRFRSLSRAALALLAGRFALAASPAFAQLAQRPFMVGGGEGGGGASGGFTGWLIEMQSQLTRLIAADVHSLHDGPAAIWGLVGFGFAYGVFHAAGPGHGKAVIASYMMASDRALKRGIVLAFLAATLQGAVAVALVGVAALIFNATSAEMNAAADWLALASYSGVVAIGLWLTATKGRALLAALKARFAHRAALAAAPALRRARRGGRRRVRARSSRSAPARPTGRRRRRSTTAACGHLHAPDPATLEAGFSWRGAAATVLAAGSRPCSGAILVLVFALAQGLFAAGIGAVVAMSFGVALTTGTLAFAAVFAKRVAMRMAAGDDSRVALAARGVEFLAALLVVVFGLALLFAAGRGA